MNDPQIPHFMPGGLGNVQKMTPEEEAEQEMKISKYINEMDDELKDRFKALKAIQDVCRDADKEEQGAIRELEVEFENKYKEIYALREALINGKSDIDMSVVAEFDERATQMKDEDYEKLEVTPCDVKSIQNIPKGISDFWIKAMLNHNVGAMITEKDRPILGYLANIELDLHSEGEGYDLIFTFLANSYFKGTEIKKSVFMAERGVCDKTTSTKIDWKDACNPTLTKKKKKKGGKKVSVECKVDSFFNFFENVDPEDSKWKNDNPEDEEGEEEDVQDRLNDEMEISDQFKDDLVPLALEYYLGVIEREEPEEDDSDDSDGGDGKKKKGGEDSDEDKPKKKKAKKVAGGAGAGGDKEECKQQ